MPEISCRVEASVDRHRLSGFHPVDRTAASTGVAEQLQCKERRRSDGVVDPAADERVGDEVRGVNVPGAEPQEPLADEHDEKCDVLPD